MQAILNFFKLTPSAKLTRDKTDTLLLLLSCALILIPHSTHLSWWNNLLLAGMLLWRAWITLQGHRLPPQWLLLPIALFGMSLVYLEFRIFFGREPGVAMVSILFVAKLLEMHARRDAFVVLMVGLFLMLTNFFYSQSIGMAIMMAIAVLFVLTTQISFQFVGQAPPFIKRLRMAATVLGLAIPLTVVLFLLFPRIEGPLWGLPGDAHTGRTGLSETMSPGNISNLAESEEIAFRAKFFGVVPDRSALYWRVIVLSNFDGRTWTHLAEPPVPPEQMPAVLRGQAVQYEITLEPHGRRWLPALEQVGSAPALPYGRSIVFGDMQVSSPRPIDDRTRYVVHSYPNYVLAPDLGSNELINWLKLPRGFNPRTIELAQQVRQISSDPVILANFVLQKFNRESYTYTLEPPTLGRDGIDDFLFVTHAGFCEHYASAFVVFMRAMGIPARVVTGFQGGELNPVDGYLEVHQSDAHAWAEIWVKGRGWIRVDPTSAVAPERIQKNLQTAIPRRSLGGLISYTPGKDSWLNSARLKWSAVTNSWNQLVLNYSSDRQKSLLRDFGFPDADWGTLTILLFVFGGGIMGLAAVWLFSTHQRADPVRALYRNLCQKLATVGITRAEYEGPRSFAARIAETNSLQPARKASVLKFLELYESNLYAAPNGRKPHETLSQLKALYSQCK